MINEFDFERFKIAGIKSQNDLVGKFVAMAKEQEKQAQIENMHNKLINALKQNQNNQSFNNISNSSIIVNSSCSNISQQIAALPKELQATTLELLNCLYEIIKTNTKPKNFKQRFGEFITNNVDKLSFLGNIALQVLPLIV